MKTSTKISQVLMRFTLSCLIAFAFIANANAQITASGGTVTGTYTSFTKAGGLFAALNGATQSGAITVSITSDVTNEDGANALNAGAWTSITINPSGARTISGAFTGSLIDFNGADNVTIDGLNASGNSLTISNTTAGVANTIRFYNDATNNTVTNCSILGAGNTTATGVVFFGTGATTGNDNNTISNCNITAAGANFPSNGIISNGTSASVDNSGITISGNNIYDYFHATTVSRAINIDATNANSSNGWTISNNKFYQTATRTYTAAILNHIIFLGTGDGFLVSGNTFGYASSNGIGVYTSTSTSAYRMIIIANNGGATIGNSIQGNTFAAFSTTSANTTGTGSMTLSCIHANNTAKVNIGTLTGNTFGATTGTGSINVIQTASGGGFVGISSATTGAVNISNNTFGAVSVTSATATHVLVLNAVNISAAVSSLTISNNTIGNATANNMVAGTLGTTTSASIVLGVCFATLPSTLVCNGNTIQNFTNNGTGTGYTKGIGGTTATNNTSSVNVYNNTVKNITSYGALAGISSGHNAVAGIQITFGLVPRIYNNTISEIVYAGSATTSVISLGIVVAQATTPVIYNNKVYAIRNRGKSVTLTSPSIAAGIAVRSSTTSDSIYNNMVSLGNGDTANAIIIGIWGNHGSTPDPAPAYLYHNSVNVEGTQNSGAMPSFCFHRGDFTATARAAAWIIKNNIFNNTRTGGTTGHFAIGNNFNATGATTGITSNYNIYNATSSATVGYHAAGAKTFAQWQAAFGDANSYTASPVTFTNTAIADLHINMGTSANQIESQGDPTVGIITDVDNDARPGPVGSVNGGGLFVDLGADEFDGSIIYSCLTNATPNTVVATPSSVSCNGSTTVLTLGTAVTTTGNSYQWQYSPDNTNWVNISGATSSSYTATIAALNNYYRCGITCANGGGAVYSTSSGNITGVSPLTAGTYTINSGAATGGTNYNTFTEAFADLACKGISGPIVFNVSGGPFVEQPVLNVVTGSSATNTITINGNGATLSFNSITSATRSGITLNGADYVTIDNLVIDGSAGTYGWGVLLTGGADYNTISNCSITVSTTNITSTNHYCIVVSGSTTSATTSGVNGSYNTFTGNTLVGGYYNIAMAGSSTVSLYNTNNTISNNNASGAYLYSFYCIYQKNATISNNDISRATRTTSSTTAGVYFTTGGGGNLIEKNRIHNMFDAVSATNTNTFYGIYIAADGTLGAENKVINNLIYNITNTNGSQYGIYNSGAAYNQIYHNSIILNGVTSTAGLTYGFYQTTAVAGVDFRNNLIYITRGGSGAKRCVYFATTTSTITSNNNNYYLNAASGTDNAIGNFGTTSYTSLFDWQAVNSNAYDQNSYNLNPQFVDAANNDFTPNAGNMDDKGANLGVTTDILGNSRSASTPDIGAIEFTGAGCTDPPTPGTATSNVTNVCGTANFTLGVSGSSSGPGQTYQWQISADNTNWTDVGTSSVNSSFVTNQASTSYYRVGLTCSGGITAYSTSVLVNTVSLLNGNYTINKNAPASSTNFQSISAAVTAMTCGVTGPVTFNVVAASGPYNERVTIPVISGASATNTVTFNGNGNTIYNKLGTASARTAITLNGADYVTINNFTINVADSTYGWGVLFTNAADYNVISNCIILTSTTDITSGNDYPIIFSGSTTSPTTSGNNGNYNTISGCTLVGGYYNVSLYGNSGTGLENIGNTFSNNTLTDSYVYSMYVLYQKDLTIKGNNISRPTRTASSTLAGIYLTTSSGGGYLIEKNIIHNMNDLQPTSTSTCYGIFISADATSYTNANKIQNNLIYNLGGNGINYGIYNSGAAFNQIYHNTIVLNDNIATSAATYGIYQTTAADVDIRNNNVYISRSGTGIKRCIHFATTTSTIISNYNNLVMDAITGTDNNVGTFGTTAFATLANWKTANSNAYDQNSLNIIPSFLDIANGNYTPTAVALNNQGINVGVNFDILDSVRSNTTPDIGAYEFDIPTCSGTPIAGTTTTNALTICNGNALHLGLSGNATGIGITYQWQFSTNNINWSNLTTELSAPDFDTVQTVTRYYRAAVSCNGNAPSYSTSVLVSTPALVSGTYTINSAVSTGGSNFQTFADAVSYISCGVDGPVVFNVEPSSGPYNEQIAIPAINGASAINTITFNGNGNTLAFSSTNTSNRAVVTLNGADYIRLDNFTINSAGGTFGWAVFFTGQADNNIVSNCNIQGDLSATSTNFAGIVFSTSFTSATTTGNNIGNNNIISNNTINGGYYGITLCGGSTSLGTNNQVINNIFTNQYVYPVYTIYQSGALVSGNDISRPTRTSVSTGYGCYLTTGVINSRFEKNRIHNLFDQATTSTSTAYAFYVAADGTAGNENKIINNLVYSLGGNGTHYGVYNTTGAYLQIYHNTFVLEGTVATSGATYGIYQTGTISGFDVKNNNISVTRSGTGIKRCLAFVTTTSAVTSNGNNLYMNAASGTDNNLCAWGTTAYANLTLWKAVNTNAFDQNSVSVNPNFVNAASGNYSPTALAVNNVGLNIGVTDDILGTLRSGNFSAGCYQNDVTAPAINYTALTTDCGPSQSTGVTLSNVVISDFTGVPTSGSTVPRIYYKKGVNGTWNSAAGTFSSSWSFTINYASIAGLTNGDSIYYYVAAQDLAAIPNVVSSPAGAVGTSVNNITSHPTANYFRAITYTPSITISTLTNSICSGNTTTFTAVSVDGGTSPVYDWRRNNISVGSGSSIDFYGGTLNTGDIITCVLTANNACQTISTVTSNSILLIVKPSPVVAQTTNQAGTAVTAASICTLGNAGITRFGNSTPFGTWSSSNSSVATVNNQGYVTGISNGTATISYTLASTNGCVVASNVLLNVAPVTTPNVITGASSVCAGSSITLSNTTPNGVWSTAQTSQATINAVTGNLLGKSAGFVTVNYTVTNAAGCSALVNKTITVNALPAVPTIAYAPGTQLGGPASPFYGAPSGSFCVGKVFTLVGTPNVPAGVWSATGAASITSGGVVTVNSVGVGTVKYTYTNTNGCVNSRTLSASGFTCASRGTNVEELAISSTDFTMYPNPARSVISLQVDKLIGGGSIVVTDLYGKAVKTQPLSMGTNNINVSSLSKGVYLVSVINNDGKTTKKLVVE